MNLPPQPIRRAAVRPDGVADDEFGRGCIATENDLAPADRPQDLALVPAPNMSVPEAKSDAREGGRFRVVMRAGDKDMPHEGTYKTIDRPNRLAFTWESPFSTLENSTVTVDFADAQDGTEVTLRHVRFPSEESRDNHKGGWTAILDALAKSV